MAVAASMAIYIFASWASCPWAFGFGGKKSDDQPTQRWLLHSISLIPENHQPAAAQVAFPNWASTSWMHGHHHIYPPCTSHPWLSEIP